ncbi:hypothetical protein GA0115236_13641, partial [Streptomyces sp. IgraMP-1]
MATRVAHAAGEFVRVAVGDRRVQADLGEAPDHLGPDGGP